MKKTFYFLAIVSLFLSCKYFRNHKKCDICRRKYVYILELYKMSRKNWKNTSMNYSMKKSLNLDIQKSIDEINKDLEENCPTGSFCEKECP